MEIITPGVYRSHSFADGTHSTGPVDFSNLDITAIPVPEPSNYLTGLSALGMLGLFSWRNRK